MYLGLKNVRFLVHFSKVGDTYLCKLIVAISVTGVPSMAGPRNFFFDLEIFVYY